MGELTNIAEFKAVIENNDWVMVYVSASWCNPCQVFAPEVEKVANIYKKILQTVKIDIEKIPEVATTYHLRSVPALLLFYRGKLVEGAIGSQSSNQVSSWLTSILFNMSEDRNIRRRVNR
jgi:thioredoxin 1